MKIPLKFLVAALLGMAPLVAAASGNGPMDIRGLAAAGPSLVGQHVRIAGCVFHTWPYGTYISSCDGTYQDIVEIVQTKKSRDALAAVYKKYADRCTRVIKGTFTGQMVKRNAGDRRSVDLMFLKLQSVKGAVPDCH